jgi:hypothetical protein
LTIGTAALTTVAACERPPVRSPAWEFPEPCRVVPGPPDHTDSITVALFDAVDLDHAPWGRNSSEQLVFRHLYETLFTIDCSGETHVGLAGSWRSSNRGKHWVFELREDARFWDATPVTARDVEWSWRSASHELNSIADAGIDSLVVDGERVLHVYFRERQKEIPRVLTAPEFAVATSSWDSRWPLGSGPYRLDDESADATGRAIRVHPAFDEDKPVIRFLETSTRDARDMLDADVDVMITSDPDVIEYASSRTRLSTVELPFDRTYVLFSTTRVQALRAGGKPGAVPEELLDKLARDAVRSDARGCQRSSWWENLRSCGGLAADVSGYSPFLGGSLSGLHRLLYDADDPIGRDIAERIVALAASDPEESPEAAAFATTAPGLVGGAARIVAEGVARDALAKSLRDGDDFGYVVPLPWRPSERCYAARGLLNRVPWLAAVDLSEALIPLVDARLHAIVDPGKTGLAVDWNGRVYVTGKATEGAPLP